MKKSKKVWFLLVLLIAIVIILFLIRGCKKEDSQVITTIQTEIQTTPVEIEEKVQEPQEVIIIEEEIIFPEIPEESQESIIIEEEISVSESEPITQQPVSKFFHHWNCKASASYCI